MSELPFISVIIPTLNEERYIERTLEALEAQDYEGSYEILVVDGGSKDHTVELVQKRVDQVLVTKPGIARQRNAGAQASRGEVLLFLDADTMLLFNALSEFARALKRKKVVGATCPIIPLTHKLRYFMFFWFFNRYARSSVRRGKARVAGACCAYRREVFERVGGFDERLRTYEDLDLSRRASRFGRFAFVETTLALTSVRRLQAWGLGKAARKYLTSHLRYLLTGEGMGAREYKPIR